MNDANDIAHILEKLRNGELEQYAVTKEEFSAFRELLVIQKDRANFRGEAKKGGGVIYTYLSDAK